MTDQDSRDRPEKEKGVTQIEVTTEMIDAGSVAMLGSSVDLDGGREAVIKVLEAVFSASSCRNKILLVEERAAQ